MPQGMAPPTSTPPPAVEVPAVSLSVIEKGSDQEVFHLVIERLHARHHKEFERADQIATRLMELGVFPDNAGNYKEMQGSTGKSQILSLYQHAMNAVDVRLRVCTQN